MKEKGGWITLSESTKNLSSTDKYFEIEKILLKYSNASLTTNLISGGSAERKFSRFAGFSHDRKLVLPNGVGFYFDNLFNDGAARISVDLNITSNRMVYGVDYFMLFLNTNKQIRAAYSFKCGAMMRGSDPNIITSVRDRCEDPGRDDYQGYALTFCSALIECNGWRVPDDYPIKF